MSLTIDQIAAVAIRERVVMEQLGSALRDDLVIANPIIRDITTFADDFLAKYDALPGLGDYDVWVDTLPENRAEGVKGVLGRLLHNTDVSGFNSAEHLAERTLPVLKQAAVKTAMGRMNSLTEVTDKTFAKMFDRIEAIGTRVRAANEWPTLAQLVRDDTLTTSPDELITGLVWRSTFTVLAAPPFCGKSELGAQGAAAFSRGREFLGSRHVGVGKVLICCVDQSMNRTVRTLRKHGAHPHNVRIYDFRKATGDLFRSLQKAIEEFNPDVVIIDSLISYTRRTAKEMPKSGDASAWNAVLDPLEEIAHSKEIGLIAYHHTTKDGSKYRDSSEIPARADVMILMSAPAKDDPAMRRFESESREDGVSVWYAAYRDGAYERADTPEDGRPRETTTKPLSRTQQQTLDALPPEGATWAEWMTLTGHPSATMHRHSKGLQERNLVVKDENGLWKRMAGNGLRRASSTSSASSKMELDGTDH